MKAGVSYSLHQGPKKCYFERQGLGRFAGLELYEIPRQDAAARERLHSCPPFLFLGDKEGWWDRDRQHSPRSVSPAKTLQGKIDNKQSREKREA